MKVAALILAGGEGRRMKAMRNKVFLEIAGRSILEWSIELFESSQQVDEIVLVARASDIKSCELLVGKYKKLTRVLPGGDIRHRSEFAGIKALAASIDANEVDLIVVHDAARPFASAKLVDRLIRERDGAIGCIPGLPLPATVVGVSDGWISSYPSGLWSVQTPQVFEATWLLEAHNKAARHGFIGTDTASVIEWAGGDVRVIEGEAANIKITTPADLQRASEIAARLG
jgi:2-C-methyl-D-erythritol 4-phosphate cytidylyltransferase